MGSAETQGKLWGAAVADYAEINEEHSFPLWEDMMAAMGVGPGTLFLDAGCGPGGGAKLAADKGARVSGLDASDAMIAYAQNRLPDGDFRVGDLEALPFEDNSLNELSHHCNSQLTFLSQPLCRAYQGKNLPPIALLMKVPPITASA